MTNLRPLRFARGLELPPEIVTETVAFLARRGAGKTYAAGKLAEELLEIGAQVVVLDPVGNWYGLRLKADGRTPGFPIPVLGGEHGDLPLEDAAGGAVAELVVELGTSAVLDVSAFSKARRKAFATDFAERLFRLKKTKRTAMHLILEEAQLFVPQRVGAADARMLGAFEDLVRLGRNYGIGVSLISQRPQSVNKEALNQAEVLVVLQTTGPQERKAIEAWISDQGLDAESREAIRELPGLERGVAWIWSPQFLRTLRRVRINKKATFDASSTPTLDGKVAAARQLAAVDLEKLRAAIADSVEAAKASDPKHLRAELATARRKIAELEARPAREVEVPILTDAQDATLKNLRDQASAIFETAADLRASLYEVRRQIEAELLALQGRLRREAVGGPPATPRAVPATGSGSSPAARRKRPRRAPARAAGARPALKAGAEKMLRIIVARGCVTKTQLATLSGFAIRGGTFGTYLGALRRLGLVELTSSGLEPTLDGSSYFGPEDVPIVETSAELLALWERSLKAGARRMLRVAIEHPHGIARDELAAAVDMEATGGTFGTYLGALRRNELVSTDDGLVIPNPELIP